MMNKELFWRLGYVKGFTTSAHTHFWNLYRDLNEDQQKKMTQAIAQMKNVRSNPL